jgi:hypothetical protein
VSSAARLMVRSPSRLRGTQTTAAESRIRMSKQSPSQRLDASAQVQGLSPRLAQARALLRLVCATQRGFVRGDGLREWRFLWRTAARVLRLRAGAALLKLVCATQRGFVKRRWPASGGAIRPCYNGTWSLK